MQKGVLLLCWEIPSGYPTSGSSWLPGQPCAVGKKGFYFYQELGEGGSLKPVRLSNCYTEPSFTLHRRSVHWLWKCKPAVVQQADSSECSQQSTAVPELGGLRRRGMTTCVCLRPLTFAFALQSLNDACFPTKTFWDALGGVFLPLFLLKSPVSL